MEKQSQFEIRDPQYSELETFKNKSLLAEIVKHISSIQSEQRRQILDAMCGTGIVGDDILNKLDCDVYYSDASPKMIATLDEKAAEKVIQADVTNMPFEANTFHGITCRAGLNNLKQEQYLRAISELIRVLKKDGILVIQDAIPDEENLHEIFNKIELIVAKLDGRNDDPYIATIDELRDYINQSGAKIETHSTQYILANFHERFKAKGIENPDFTELIELLRNQNALKFIIKNDELVLLIPVVTMVVRKSR